ncbi:MAG TPA: alpha/beta hydrolase [Candidatus Methylomirabilis sp.]|nr:alpha/beta hydrolase [Candidatus Methylomirabilis sp.]
MGLVRVGEVALAVQEWPGKGPAVVCIHGLTANHTSFASVAHSLSPEYRLIAYDLRGRGDSDKPAQGYSIKIHCQDLRGLLDHYGLRKAIILGHSLGAHIGVAFAVQAPERVSRLILVDGGIDVRPEILDSIAPAINRLGIEFPSLEAFLRMLQGLPMFAGRWNEYLDRYYRYDVEALPTGAVRSKVAKYAIEEELRSLSRGRLWTSHHRLKCPTLILRAPDGLMTSTDCLMTEEEGRALAHAIPKSKLVVIPNTNHYTILMGSHPRVRSALRTFLRSK